jgi:chromosome segregation ATPase
MNLETLKARVKTGRDNALDKLKLQLHDWVVHIVEVELLNSTRVHIDNLEHEFREEVHDIQNQVENMNTDAVREIEERIGGLEEDFSDLQRQLESSDVSELKERLESIESALSDAAEAWRYL